MVLKGLSMLARSVQWRVCNIVLCWPNDTAKHTDGTIMNNRIIEIGLNLAAMLIVMVGVMFAAQGAFVV